MTEHAFDETTLRRIVAEELGRALQPVLDALRDQGRAQAALDGDGMVTREQLAEFMQVDVRTLRRMELEGVIPPGVRLGDRSVRWRRSTIEKWLDKSEKPLRLTAGRGSVFAL